MRRVAAVGAGLALLVAACTSSDGSTPGGAVAKNPDQAVASSLSATLAGAVVGSSAGVPRTGAQASERAGSPHIHIGAPGGDAATTASASAAAPANEPAVLEGCRERFVIMPGVEAEVRARVPEPFELSRNRDGQPLLYVTALRCERYTAAGATRPTTVAAFAASVISPDGTACASAWPGVGEIAPAALGQCHNYLLFAAYDHPGVVEWAAAGVPDLPVHHVPELSFDEGPLDPGRVGVPLEFSAAGATPSHYQLSATVRERPVMTPLTGSFWFRSEAGMVRFRFEAPELAFGEADGRVEAAEGSEMATVLGSASPRPQPGFSMLAGTHWDRATMTKTITPAWWQA